ncbi:hypothetical protein [Synechococcus phage Yong-M2-251]|nr:hypothetical protein [Synechococcus phage Yong-M2-251]
MPVGVVDKHFDRRYSASKVFAIDAKGQEGGPELLFFIKYRPVDDVQCRPRAQNM